MKEKLRIGVIGVGHLGEFHVQKYVAMPEVELVGVVDTNPDRANEIARRYNTRPYGEHHDILQRVDAVSLAVPTEKHFELAKDILSEGVHLLVEKPITYTLEPADTLINMAREKDLVLQVGLVERFNPAVVTMKSMLKEPVFVESHRMNIFTTRGTDVDVVLDLMIHDLDIILHVVPSEVEEIHAVGISVITGKTDIANVRMIFGNGTVGNLTASRVSDKTLRKIRVFQPDAYIAVDCFKREISVTRLDSEVKDSSNFPQVTTNKTKFPGSDPLADEISSFVHAVMNGVEPVVSGPDGRRALKYALGIIDQIERGCRNFQAIC
ncbi:MAG: Gfo/Idh/MocA family oxidoreductase [Deltaproteobacteria bacterium]|nr:MAG: Gfo/Idh/MocA family oxidoreductase [Deltaproteobacteria bacterium]